ncbi:DUF6516 family protein [Bdellovibrionota bacterium FG-2]
MKATRLFHHKARVHGHYVMELDIVEVGDPVRYPDGIKYSMVCVNARTGQKVLLDNHHPKGPHLHLDDVESAYAFINIPSLMADFERLVLEHLGVKL